MNSDCEHIKRAARGRWLDILSGAGLNRDILDGKGHPCPKCEGTDRFHSSKNVASDGKVFCRGCFNSTSTIKPGDGIASVAWILAIDNVEAARWVADYLGLGGKEPVQVDIIAAVAIDKRMPLEAFRQFNPTPDKRGRDKKLVARVPVVNERGEAHSYFDLAPGCKGWFARGDGMSGMFFPGRLPQHGETWCLVEGVKDASALIGLGFVAAGMPSSFLAAKYARLFEGVNVVLVHDLDKPGMAGAQKTGGNLSGIASSVLVVRMPGEIRESNGEDVRDVLRRPDGASLVRDAIANAKPWQPSEGQPTKDDRPEVLVTLTEGFVADQVVKHLGKLGWESPWIPECLRESCKVFSRGGVLTHAIESEDPSNRGQLVTRPIPSAIIRERITQACQLAIEVEKEGELEIVPTRPPKWLIDAVDRRGWFSGNIRPLTGIIQAPTIRSDGSILQSAGYDSSTGLLYRPNASFPTIPDKPTVDDAKRAIDELLHVVVDFPFLDDEDKSAWLTLVLSFIGRQCVRGCVPMFTVTANIRGSGKSLLVDAASIIAFGRPAARKTFTRDDDEMRKAITAIALEAVSSVLFDNLDGQLGGAALDAVLTAEVWSDRILGSSRTTGELPMRTVWAATGNNMAFGSDVARRVLPIRLQSDLEAPEDRTGFEHADLLGWVSANRPKLAAAALTILRAYFVAGCPEQPDGVWGSFEAWSKVIRGSVVWAGASDPLPTRRTATDNDDARSQLGMLITALEEADPDHKGLTIKEIERLTSHRVDELPTCPTLLEAVAEICGDRFHARKFAYKLRSFVGRGWQGRKIECEKAGGGVKRWRVKSGSGGSGGLPPPKYNAQAVCVSPLYTHTEHTHARDRQPGETNPPEPPQQPPRVCSCGSLMVAGEAFGNARKFRNWECPDCEAVIPEEVFS